MFQEKEKEIALHAKLLEDEKEEKIVACKELMKETGLMSESERSQKQCQEISANYEELVKQKDLEIEKLKADKRALIEKVKYQDQLVEKANASAPIAMSVHIQTALVAVGGLTRFTIISDQFHQQNPEFCRTFLGFINYNEAKIYISVHFQVIPHELYYDEKTASFPNMSDYEQLFMESMCHRSRLAEIYGLDRTRIGRIITKWAPRWGKFGERLSILPVPHDYFHKESPIEYDARGLEEVSVLFDGKDTLTESIRKDSSLNRRQQSSKMKAAAMRYLNFSTPAGLSVEHTRAYGARPSEVAHVIKHGSLGKKKADLENWKDCCPMDYKYGSDKDYFVPTTTIASANEIKEIIGEPPQTQDSADIAETGDIEAVENDEDNANMFVNFLDNFMDRKLQEHELDNHLEVNDASYSPEEKQSASILNEPERLLKLCVSSVVIFYGLSHFSDGPNLIIL